MEDVIVPALGMAMTEVVLTRWRKQPGDTLGAGEVVAEIETDKSDVELAAPSAGVLGRHLFPEGATVPIGTPVVRILAPGDRDEALSPERAPAATVPGAEGPANTSTPDPPAADSMSSSSADASVSPASPPSAASYRRTPHSVSPRQRRLARVAADASGSVTIPAESARPVVNDRRRAITTQVEESWRTIPQFSVQRAVDARDAVAALRALRELDQQATFTDILLRALALAVENPMPSEGDIGLAVATPDGVMLPVVPAVRTLGPAALVRARVDAVRRGRDGRLSARDLAGGANASLSNLGSRDVDSFTGIVPMTQQLLLTVGRVAPRPVAVGGHVEVRPTMVATINVDHRALDGDGAAAILSEFAREFGAVHAWVEGDRS